MIKNLILDIDNTLVDVKQTSIFDDYKNEDISKIKFQDIVIRNLNMRMFYRPGLEDFLNFCCNNFNVSVWSAADPTYVKTITDELFIKNNFKVNYVLSSDEYDDCKFIFNTNFKDLRYTELIYNLNLKETMLIDNFMNGYIWIDDKKQNLYRIRSFQVIRYVPLSIKDNLIKPGFQFNSFCIKDKELDRCKEELKKYLN